jgi:hypothetical protein
MKLNTLLPLLFFSVTCIAQSETGPGIGIYPTGTETGIGLRTGKNSKIIGDFRVSKANFYSVASNSSFITEASAVIKLVQLEKVRFHLGLGGRAEWNFGGKPHKAGAVMPVGVEAFPFPFQNAGLFFEAAPFFTMDYLNTYTGGIRTVAGFIFYFPLKKNQAQS